MNSSSDSIAPQSCAICSVCAACPEEGWDAGPSLPRERGGVGQRGFWLFLRDQHTEKCPHPAPAMRQGLGDTGVKSSTFTTHLLFPRGKRAGPPSLRHLKSHWEPCNPCPLRHIWLSESFERTNFQGPQSWQTGSVFWAWTKNSLSSSLLCQLKLLL